MTTPKSVAIYTRMSSDPDGTALGVERQEQDCRVLADQLGWVVAEVYVDNDVSAYSGKVRPAFERLMLDVSQRHRDAVLCAHVDRLTRGLRDLVRVKDVLDEAKVELRFASGPAGMTGDGMLLVGMMALVAENESATKSRRQKRKNEQKAAMGEPHGGANRPFGYERDGLTVVEPEAVVIRQLAARFLAGESLRSLTTWLDATGVRTVNGNPWRTTTVRAVLRSGRIAGLRELRGEVVGKAKWPPIITERERDRILHLFETKKVSGRRAPRRYLLSGMLRCGKCGHPLYSAARQTTRRYVCASGPDHGGCGRLTVVAAPVEDLITAAALFRLDTPELADALAGRAAQNDRTAALSRALAEDREQLDELTALYARKQITAREWMSARSEIETRIRTAETQLAHASGDHALSGLVGTGSGLQERWQTTTLDQKAAIVAAVLDHAVIAPGISGARSLDPDRVIPYWRL